MRSGFVNRIYCFQVRAPADLSKYAKSLKKLAVKKFFGEVKIENDGFNLDNYLSSGEVDAVGTVTGNFEIEFPDSMEMPDFREW